MVRCETGGSESGEGVGVPVKVGFESAKEGFDSNSVKGGSKGRGGVTANVAPGIQPDTIITEISEG